MCVKKHELSRSSYEMFIETMTDDELGELLNDLDKTNNKLTNEKKR